MRQNARSFHYPYHYIVLLVIRFLRMTFTPLSEIPPTTRYNQKRAPAEIEVMAVFVEVNT